MFNAQIMFLQPKVLDASELLTSYYHQNVPFVFILVSVFCTLASPKMTEFDHFLMSGF